MADTPQFLYRIVPTRSEMLVSGPTAHERQVIDAHFAHLQALAADGVVLMAGRTTDTGPATWGIVVFTAPSLAEAEVVMRADPVIAQGVMRGELFAYRVAVWSEPLHHVHVTELRSAQDCALLSLLSHDFRL